MHVTIAHLSNKPNDFKICLTCGCFNWYENKMCHSCSSTKFRDATQKDVDDYIKVREKDQHFCMECEIEA